MTLQRMALLGAAAGALDDAAAYLAAVEAADGQALEAGVRTAITNFVDGCKADNIWNAIRACCILAGARTLAGALVPLTGPAPTNVNFVSADYNRKTGLVSNGSNKYLISNLAYNAIPTSNEHLSVFLQTAAAGNWIGGGTTTVSFSRCGYISTILRFESQRTASADYGSVNYNNFVGVTRASSSSQTARYSGSSNTQAVAASTRSTTATSYGVFCANYSDVGIAAITTARIPFYSIGESLNLTLLDSRVTTLINALAAAIP